jgi:two-component system, NtrC family, sensor histidine kinase PilS
LTIVISVPHESRETFWRSLHALNITRIVISGLLLVFWSLGSQPNLLSESTLSYRSICLIYLALAVVFSIFTLYERRHFLLQVLSQIVVDIVIVSVLYLAAGGIKGGITILYLFPLASAAILVRMLQALFLASVVTLFLLIETWFRFFHGQYDAPSMQAGLYGAAFFAAVFVINRLAAKLITQEKLAIQHSEDLQIQQTINRLVIADMDDGVLVVGSDSTIFACNPSAEANLGLLPPSDEIQLKLTDIPYLKPLADAFLLWHTHRLDPARSHVDPIVFLVIKPAAETILHDTINREGMSPLGIHLKVRFATAATDALPKDRSVIFLQDVAKIEDQAQQLKLASMGRLTASIAHEVRNPLAAIAHASALLGEDAATPAQYRLLTIVSDNVARMDSMIEDILNLSRKAQSQEIILLSTLVDEIKGSFEEIHALPRSMILVEGLEQFHVRFDPMHLREVLLNLLTNAIRYASGKSGSIHIHAVQATSSRLELHVQDDGPSISSEVRAHLFEPFYTTSSKGTGLGLYLARELCSNNGAKLDYEFHLDTTDSALATPSGRFVITFTVPDLTHEGFLQ